MTLRYMTGESADDEDRRNCSRCDHYRGYVCADHRKPTYAEQAAEIELLRAGINAACELADTGSKRHREAFDPHDCGEIPAGWRVAEKMREALLGE